MLVELWQMDVVGGVRLADGAEAKIISGIDDHSRFVVSAHTRSPGPADGAEPMFLIGDIAILTGGSLTLYGAIAYLRSHRRISKRKP